MQQGLIDPRQRQPLRQTTQQPVVIEHIAEIFKRPDLLQPTATEKEIGRRHEHIA